MKHLLTISLLFLLSSANICEEYRATVLSVYDGDTMTCNIEIGFDLYKLEKVRLSGIDAPEVRGEERPEGLKSRDALRELTLGKQLRLVNEGTGKYGRTIATLYLDTINISDWMVRNGYAEYKAY
jgi:micrococcal nuclease